VEAARREYGVSTLRSIVGGRATLGSCATEDGRWQSSAATPLSRAPEKPSLLERGFATPDSPPSSAEFQAPKEKRRGGLAAFPPPVLRSANLKGHVAGSSTAEGGHSIGATTGSHGDGRQPGPTKSARSVAYPNSKASRIGLY